MKQIIWTCDQCGFKDETEGDWMPEGWIHDLKKSKVYHHETCMFVSMTPDEMDRYNKAIQMASPPDLGVKVSDGIGAEDIVR